MSTSHVPNPASSPTPPTPETHHDEFTGAFGIFRKYQKVILYTAVMFALVTFSITGAMTDVFRKLSAGSVEVQATVTVNGVEHRLTNEDYAAASMLVQNLGAVGFVLPDLGERTDTGNLRRRFAALRRISIASGFDVSMTEVDKAIATVVATVNSRNQNNGTPVTAIQIARIQSLDSLAHYRDVMREAMRIGNYVRLNALGVDGSDPALLAAILDDQEKITLQVAQFDRQALEAELKKKGDVKEEDFKKWLEGKTELEKNQMQVYDTNLVSLLFGIGRFETFNPEQWATELKDFKLGDDRMKQLYEELKDDLFKLPEPKDGKKYQAMDEQAVKDQLTKVAKLDEVLNQLRTKLVTAQQDTLKPLNEEWSKCVQEKSKAQAARDSAKAASTAKPDDADLKQKLVEAENIFIAKETAEKDAKTKLDDGRKGFDFRGKFTEAVKDKAGFELQELKGPKNAEGLKDLSAAPLALGEWKQAQYATNLQNVGDLSGLPGRTAKGAFLYQATEVVVRPLKPWDKIKDKVEETYFIEQAKKVGEDKKKALEEQLLTLAKGKIPDKVKEIEAKKQGEIDRRFAEWEKKQTETLAEADKMLATLAPGLEARRVWQATRDAVDAELKNKDQKKKSIEDGVTADLDNEVKAEAKKKYPEVMEAAATAAGFTVATFGPTWREAAARVPGFAKSADKAQSFFWAGAGKELKVGEATDILEDATNRRWLMAQCTKVEPLTIDDIPRKEYEMKKRSFTYTQLPSGAYQNLTFAEAQLGRAIEQSFTLDAIKDRYKFKEDERKQDERKAK